ncbi:hypothetical protein PANA5342_3363 [Pantoea ananatis LMG 5342]|nr:hypothetical protein PANA5342_3363 [Pantoea ananatis LMG 5342]
MHGEVGQAEPQLTDMSGKHAVCQTVLRAHYCAEWWA